MSSTTRPTISGLGRPGHSTTTSSTSTHSSSSSLTSPLKLTKQTTAYASSHDLVGGQKGGAPLARRQSSSFNHVRTSSLVSSSPFKTGGDTNSARYGTAAKTQKAPVQLQHSDSPTAFARSPITTSSNNSGRSRSDENKPIDGVRKPRESKGFQTLPEKEAVTKSPFVEGNGVSPSTRVGYSRSADFARDFNSSSGTGIGRDNAKNIVKSTSYPVTATLANEPSQAPSLLAPNHSLGARPLPGTPQKPARPMSMVIPGPSVPLTSSPLASSPRSNLVNKRLIGPRSPDTSTTDANKRERRKTVTWDERCDVMEFDMESDVTESVQDTEDERKDDEDGSELEEERARTPPVTKREETNDFFGPDRESGRSPSPILSGSINDAVEDNEVVELLSNASAMSDDETATPQKETIPLPEEPYVPQFVDINSFLSNHESFREDSVSTHDDSFTSRLRNEPDETSFRLSESRSPERFPRISRDAIRRQVEQQKMEFSSDNVLTTPSRPKLSIDSPRRSFDGVGERSSPNPFRASFQPSPDPKRAEEILNSSRSGTQIDDVQSALDKLMLGVEKGFEPSIRSNISNMEDDRMSDGTASDDNSFAPQSYGRYGHGGEERTMVIDADEEEEDMAPSDLPVLRESTAMSGADTESTDGPFTPQMHETASLDASPQTLHRPIDMDHSFATSKPLPPPPPSDDTFTPPPTVRVLENSDSEDDTPINPGPAFTLSAPVPSDRVIPKRGNTIKMREEAIKAKRRELRAAEGRPARRRSQSTGDLKAQIDEDEKLELAHTPENEPGLEDQFRTEVAKLEPSKKKYMLKQRRPTIYASDSRVGHLGVAGDVHGGKAWRTVRRPSDMNEYSKQLRQLRNQEKGGNSHGKVFVKVIGIRDLDVPLPSQPTYFSCVLNNGIHFVETPASKLEHEALIDQEFELIEHEKLEFTLTIKVRKDPHIAQILSPPPIRPTYAPSRVETPTKSKGGMRSFFSSPAKKPSKAVIREPEPVPQPIQTTDPFGRYLKKDLSIARALVAFKDIVGHCDCKLFETSYPLVGQVSDGNAVVTKTVGEIVLQIFRLPPIPGVDPNELPQSLDECHRGLRHVQWHKVVYHEGILTQLGGDCTTWRRRNMRVMGANLIAYNDVTKKPIATIDLRKVTLVEDDGGKGNEPTIITPPSEAVAEGLNPPKQLRRKRSFNALAGIDNSFRVVFENNTDDEVCFFADTAEERQRWMEIFGALVGRIPHNPLWAEIIWQRQQELLSG